MGDQDWECGHRRKIVDVTCKPTTWQGKNVVSYSYMPAWSEYQPGTYDDGLTLHLEDGTTATTELRIILAPTTPTRTTRSRRSMGDNEYTG
ncbi:hypothetical protein ACFLQN_02880 [Candidatus Aenigmatarchaeota archaeon]